MEALRKSKTRFFNLAFLSASVSRGEMFLAVQGLSKSRPVFFQNAEVHGNEHPGFACLFGGFFIDDSLLHPNGWNFQPDCLIHDVFHEFRTTKIFSQRFGNGGIHGDDLVPLSLHVGGDTMAGAQRTV